MHLSYNAASTTFVFLFMVFAGVPGLFALYRYLNKKEQMEDPELFLCGINGKIEYLKSWYIFWDDIVPEVYAICKERFDHPVGVYDVEFADIGYELYGCEPAVEALNRSMSYMKSIGRTHHVNYAEAERWYHHYRRPDLSYRTFEVVKKTYDQQYPEIVEPDDNDRRRLYCLCSDGVTEVLLKDGHVPRRQ